MNQNSEFVTRMQAQLKKWDSDVAALSDEAKKVSAQTFAAYEEGLKNLKSSREAAQKNFQQICVATEAAGTSMLERMESAWTAMQDGLHQVSADLKKKE